MNMVGGILIGNLLSFVLIGGLYYLTFKNSPKHANILLLIVASGFGLSFIKPVENYLLLILALGIVAVFIVIIQSRKARDLTLYNLLIDTGFRRIEFPFVETLFNKPASTILRHLSYKGELTGYQQNIPFVMVIRYSSLPSGKTTRIIVECSYYFNEKIDVDLLFDKFKIAKENTANPRLWQRNLKSCDIFRPAIGGIVVNWSVSDAIEGYRERHEWIKNALQNQAHA
jgi:hypothetical protein